MEELMNAKRATMICPACGDEMNYHADKLVYPEKETELKFVDAALGGAVAEFHSCPGCGAAASRLAA
jgi:predicted RNA-binding Zn-ribbon protein involved in translation (DUF1610 family)